MPKQQRVEKQASSRDREDEGSDVQPQLAETAELTSDMDDILEEIDSVLEENAEQMVRDYVQKGGQ